MARRAKAPAWTPDLFSLAEEPVSGTEVHRNSDGPVPGVVCQCARGCPADPCMCPCHPAKSATFADLCKPAGAADAPLHAVGLHRTSLPPHTLMVLRTQAGIVTVGDLVALAGRRGLSIADAVRQVTTRPGWLPETPEEIQRAVEWWVKEVASGGLENP